MAAPVVMQETGVETPGAHHWGWLVECPQLLVVDWVSLLAATTSSSCGAHEVAGGHENQRPEGERPVCHSDRTD